METQLSLPKNGAQPANFRPMSIVAKGLDGSTWRLYEGRPRAGQHCVRCGPNSTPMGHSPQFSANVCCGQTAGWIKIPLDTKVCLGPGHILLHVDPAPPKGAQPPLIFGPCLLWPNGHPSQLLLSTCYQITLTTCYYC